MKTGCCGSTDTYVQISKSGYDYAELSGRQLMSLSDYQREDFLKLYRETGFPCPYINDYCGHDVAIVGPDFSTSVIRHYASRIMDYASKLGVKYVGIGAPAARKLPEGYPRERAMFEMMTFLYITCEEAAKYDITVLLEALHSGLADYVNFTSEAVTIVNALRGENTDDIDPETMKLAVTAVAGRKKPDNLFIVYDYYNSKAQGEDLGEMVKAMPLIKHLQYSTDLGENDRGFPGPEQLSELTEFLKTASDNGYTGNISVEADYTRYLNYDGVLCARIMKMALPGQV